MTIYRIQKLISSYGICSRRSAERLIKEGHVLINGQIAKIGDSADSNIDRILVNGEHITNVKIPFKKVFLINKPKGLISSCFDPEGRNTVLDLLPEELRAGLYPAGRLDLNSRGAMILSNDGELTFKLTHPKFLHSKTYLVWLKGNASNRLLNKWRRGIILESKLTMKAKIEKLKVESDKTLIKIILTEGRNRQIRKIADLIGHPVIDIQRIAIGAVFLNGLKEGRWRKLKGLELEDVLK